MLPLLSFSNRTILDDGSDFGGDIGADNYQKCYGLLSSSTGQNEWDHTVLEGDKFQKAALLARVRSAVDAGKQLLFYVHGYCNSLETCLNGMTELAEKYNVEVIALDWASEGHILEYFEDERNAKDSYAAFGNTVRKIGQWLEESGVLMEVSANMLVHSMGGLVFKTYEEHDHPLQDTAFLTNIGLVEADVTHTDLWQWCDRVKHAASGRFYVSINPEDYALAASTLLHGGARIGDDVADPYDEKITYINLGDSAGIRHSPYLSPNPVVHQLFARMLGGQDATEGLIKDHEGYYKVPEAAPSDWSCALM